MSHFAAASSRSRRFLVVLGYVVAGVTCSDDYNAFISYGGLGAGVLVLATVVYGPGEFVLAGEGRYLGLSGVPGAEDDVIWVHGPFCIAIALDGHCPALVGV